ncbi:hypothetical protein F183_A34570 [Bryobacterales bacterium F-183]|nr:hypothetical protein F183_A34570 [Bryobacterales bacterium F-183]
MSWIRAGVASLLVALGGCQTAEKPKAANGSVFTSLSPEKCPNLLCPGVGGFQLAVAGSSVELVAPSGRRFPLTSVAPTPRQAEWRTSGDTPVAVILGGSPTTIAKVSADQACVTARLSEADASIATVHQAADAAPTAACLQ